MVAEHHAALVKFVQLAGFMAAVELWVIQQPPVVTLRVSAELMSV
jgi:hypothetical protein